MIRLRHLCRDSRAASAAEFALVLPLLLLLLFGIIDGGRLMWDFNRAEKATQMGARFAAVTDPILGSGFSDYSFAVSDAVTQGTAVPTANFDTATCTAGACSCVGGAVCGSVAYDGTAFQAVVDRMAAIYPQITAANVAVDYKNVGLGYSGDPNGPDVAPLVTVRLTNLTFQPITTVLFGLNFSMPDFATSLTGEDLNGTDSN